MDYKLCLLLLLNALLSVSSWSYSQTTMILCRNNGRDCDTYKQDKWEQDDYYIDSPQDLTRRLKQLTRL